MLNLINCTIGEFKENTKDKKLVIFGAGQFGEYSISALSLSDRLLTVVDNGKNKAEITDPVSQKCYPVVNIEKLSQIVQPYTADEMAILITPAAAMADIVAQLDSIEAVDGVDCYLLGLLRQMVDASAAFSFYEGEEEIPKVIHYFWIGGKEIPDDLKRYVDTWKKFCPDYDIIRWDESNYDFTKNKYMQEAYENRMWSFATDWARLDVIYKYGGIYLDIDVELIKPLDKLIKCDAFFGFANTIEVSTGIGFGAVPHHSIIKEMMDVYTLKSFYNEDGTINKRLCSFYQNPVLSNWGFDSFSGKYQERNGVVIYPCEVFSPYGDSFTSDRNEIKAYSEMTVGIHRNYASWIGKGVKDKKLVQLERIMKRLKNNRR